MKKAFSICFSTFGLLRTRVDRLHNYFSGFLFMAALFIPFIGNSQQQTQMSDYVLFSGAASPGNVQIGSSSNINGGSVGSLKLVNSTGTSTIKSNIFSKGTIALTNSNTVVGKIAASNSPAVTGTILSVGSSANLSGAIDVNGNIVIGGGVVSGPVTTSGSYTGPTTVRGSGAPSLPLFPALPPITPLASYIPSADITATRIISPGAYGAVKLSGNQKLTFDGVGVYSFNLIDNKNSNTFEFKFGTNTTGVFQIYIYNNAVLQKLDVTMIGGDASRIYTEVQGTGLGTAKYAFDINNGSTSGSKSRWMGTVWAPNAAINVGSGTGQSEVNGALWSGTQVNLQSGVTINHVPLTCFVSVSGVATNASCFGVSDGSIAITKSSNATVVVTNKATGAPMTSTNNLPAGTYLLTATSSFSGQTCTETKEVIIGQPSVAVTVSGIATNASCYGVSDGSIAVTNSSGSTVVIKNKATNAVVAANNLAAGIYT